MRLLLFNPDTEYALAKGASFYTPPAVVAELAASLRLLPEKWARPDDIILVDDAGATSSCRVADWSMLSSLFSELPDLEIEPWGWNHALRRKLLDFGVPESSLPTIERLGRLREMAHRRSTIILNELWNRHVVTAFKVPVPVELFSEQECVDYFLGNPGCWMKAPWSSSGRGVINTGADMEERHVRPWCRGILRRQRSVMAEQGADKVADFATEWRMGASGACYLGLSSFITSRRGKYVANHPDPQPELETRFNRLSSLSLDYVLSVQKSVLEEVFGNYSGLLGVDMIVERSGAVRPFVEVNLRRTMGMLGLPDA